MSAFCPDEEFLARFIEGDLGESESAQVASHLASCDDCRRAVTLSRLSLDGSPAGLRDEQERAARAIVAGGHGCPEEQRLARWIDGKSDEEERASVVRHIGNCDRCRRAVALAWISTRDPIPRASFRAQEAARQVVRERVACPDENRLAGLLKGTINDGERVVVMEHLAGCDDCRRALALARAVSDEPVHALSAGQEQSALRLVLARTARMRRRSWQMAAAAAVLLAAAVIFIVARPVTPTDSPSSGRGVNHADVPPPKDDGRKPVIDNTTEAVFGVDIGKTDIAPNRLIAGTPADEPNSDYARAEIVDGPIKLHRWIGVEIASPVSYARGMVVRVRYRTNAEELAIVVDGHPIKIVAKSKGVWVEEDCSLAYAQLAPGDAIRTLYVGTPSNVPLDIDYLHIRRQAP